MADDLQQIANPTPNAQLLAALYPSSSPNNSSKNFAQQSAQQNGLTTGGINSESATATGATASQNGTNPSWTTSGESNDIPSNSNTSASTTSNTNNLQNPTTGNTQASTNATAGQITSSNMGLTSGNSSLGVQNPQQQAQSNPFSGLSNLGSTVANQLGLTSGITNAVNSFGAANLGTGLSQAQLLSSYGVAPSAQSEAMMSAADEFGNAGLINSGNVVSDSTLANAGSLTGATASSILGAAGAGAIGGGFLASALGENRTGGSIGGGIGAAAGEAFGAAGAAELGLELGSFAGPIGAIAGGAIGAIVGGLFGNSSPGTTTSYFGGTLGTSGLDSSVGPSFKGQSTAFGQSMNTQMDTLFDNATSSLGINWNNASTPISVAGGFNSLHSGPGGSTDSGQPGYLDINGQRFNFDPSNEQSTATAYYSGLSLAAQDAGYTNTNALYNWFYGVPGGDASQGFTGVSIAPAGTTTSGPILA